MLSDFHRYGEREINDIQRERKNRDTASPRSSCPLYIVTYYIKWGTTSWTDGKTLNKITILFMGITDIFM